MLQDYGLQLIVSQPFIYNRVVTSCTLAIALGLQIWLGTLISCSALQNILHWYRNSSKNKSYRGFIGKNCDIVYLVTKLKIWVWTYQQTSKSKMIAHRNSQLFDTMFMVKVSETSSGRKAWVEDGWKTFWARLKLHSLKTTRGAEQSAPPPRHNTPTALCEQCNHMYVVFMYAMRSLINLV